MSSRRNFFKQLCIGIGVAAVAPVVIASAVETLPTYVAGCDPCGLGSAGDILVFTLEHGGTVWTRQKDMDDMNEWMYKQEQKLWNYQLS